MHGRILDEHGRPVTDATVAVEHEAQAVVSDAHGWFTISDVPLRGYLIVTKRGYLTALVSLVAATDLNGLDEIAERPQPGLSDQRIW